MKKILVCGLPGAGKTTLAIELKKQLQEKGKTVTWLNADDIRHMYLDWDFSMDGRLRQAKRMKGMSDGYVTDYVICDFVAPTEETRKIFAADFTIWMATIKKSEYKDTNKMFEDPSYSDFMVTEKNAVEMAKSFVQHILQLE